MRDCSRYRPAHHNAAVLPSRSASSPHSRLSASLGARATLCGRASKAIVLRLASSRVGTCAGAGDGASRPASRVASSKAGVCAGADAGASGSLYRFALSRAGVGSGAGAGAGASKWACRFVASQRCKAPLNSPITWSASTQVSAYWTLSTLRLARDRTLRRIARIANGQFMAPFTTNVV